MCTLKVFVTIGCLLSVVVARPQFNNPTNPFFPSNTGISPNIAVPTTTAAPANVVTTPSPQYLACLQSCPTTSEYNPVCGSDTLNYHNTGRLQCAQRCGQNVAMVRMGTCRPL